MIFAGVILLPVGAAMMMSGLTTSSGVTSVKLSPEETQIHQAFAASICGESLVGKTVKQPLKGSQLAKVINVRRSSSLAKGALAMLSKSMILSSRTTSIVTSVYVAGWLVLEDQSAEAVEIDGASGGGDASWRRLKLFMLQIWLSALHLRRSCS